MKKFIFALIIAILVVSGLVIFLQLNRTASISDEDVIFARQGWKAVVLGATRESVDKFLGSPENIRDYSDVYFADYYSKGVEVNFNKLTNRAKAIFFYHRQYDMLNFNSFNKKTNKGIGFDNTVEEVLRVYGKPTEDYNGQDNQGTWQRVAYKGIDFRFENGRMIRISVSW